MMTEKLYQAFRGSKGISTDTRTLKRDQIFFALWGENYNGNKFAAEAIAKGAMLAVIDDPLFETEKTILVDDCLFELQALASHYRKELKASVLAITGTNGKTTTKELLSAILSRKYKVHATAGNLNNQIGVPLTILSAPPDTKIMIVEMGANHIGEIRSLCLIARPDYGIITNISPAHIEGFGSFEGVVKAKTELYEYLRKVNGIALYNEKDHLLAEKIFKLINRAVPFSDPTGIDLVVETVEADLNLVVKVVYHHKEYIINTKMFGEVNTENIKAAVATGLFLEVPVEEIVSAVESYSPSNNRSQIKKTKSNTLICDSYNANPESMRKAISSFSKIDKPEKMCILGDMLELGEKSSSEHTGIVNLLIGSGIEKVLVAGPLFKKAAKGTGIMTFNNAGEIKDYISSNPVEGYHILIKGSRGMQLETLYDAL